MRCDAMLCDASEAGRRSGGYRWPSQNIPEVVLACSLILMPLVIKIIKGRPLFYFFFFPAKHVSNYQFLSNHLNPASLFPHWRSTPPTAIGTWVRLLLRRRLLAQDSGFVYPPPQSASIGLTSTSSSFSNLPGEPNLRKTRQGDATRRDAGKRAEEWERRSIINLSCKKIQIYFHHHHRTFEFHQTATPVLSKTTNVQLLFGRSDIPGTDTRRFQSPNRRSSLQVASGPSPLPIK